MTISRAAGIFSLASLALCTLSIVFGLVSYRRAFYVKYKWEVGREAQPYFYALCADARVIVDFSIYRYPECSRPRVVDIGNDGQPGAAWRFETWRPPERVLSSFEWFGYEQDLHPADDDKDTQRLYFRRVTFPLPVLSILLAIPPARRARRMRLRRARSRDGQCVVCGYDLRFAPSVRCPECGAAREPKENLPT